MPPTSTRHKSGCFCPSRPNPRNAASVPSYTGTSKYLVLTKYNNYAGAGGDGVNKLAVLDPNASFVHPISGGTVLR